MRAFTQEEIDTNITLRVREVMRRQMREVMAEVSRKPHNPHGSSPYPEENFQVLA